MSRYHIGMEVICVDDKKPKDFNPLHFPNWVKKDSKYIIRSFEDNDGIVLGIRLEGMINPILPIGLVKKWQEGAYATWRFAPGLSAFEVEEQTEEVEDEKVEKLIEDIEKIVEETLKKTK